MFKRAQLKTALVALNIWLHFMYSTGCQGADGHSIIHFSSPQLISGITDKEFQY